MAFAAFVRFSFEDYFRKKCLTFPKPSLTATISKSDRISVPTSKNQTLKKAVSYLKIHRNRKFKLASVLTVFNGHQIQKFKFSTVTVRCGQQSAENCTYFLASGTETGSCNVKMCPAKNVCQLRLDFAAFNIAQPSTSMTKVEKAVLGTILRELTFIPAKL